MSGKLVGLDGSKVEVSKKPIERLYEFVISANGAVDSFTSFGVLVVTPGFVGVGDPDGTEIRTVVPLGILVRVTALQATAGNA
jgi:hypothetical protein